MKRKEICNILSKFNFEPLISKNMNPNKISDKISLKLGETKAPTQTAIKTYIKNTFNLQWDTKTKSWISYQKDANSNKIRSKKSHSKDNNTITICHESELDEDVPYEKAEMNSLSNKLDNHSETEENSNTQSNTDISSFKAKNEENKLIPKKDTTNTKELKDENILPAEYAEYITAFGTNKYSLSLSCFILELIEQRISKKYNLTRKGNRSKIIQIALTEYLRITK